MRAPLLRRLLHSAIGVGMTLGVLVSLTGCHSKPAQKPAAAPPGTPPPRTPAWTEVPQDQRSDENKAVDSASRGVK